jgi:outer membrane protein assembly factor BamB
MPLASRCGGLGARRVAGSRDAYRIARVPRWAVVAAFLVAACGHESAQPDPGGIRGFASAADRQLVWRVPGKSAFSEPTVGEDQVFFLAADHSLTAVSKVGGAVRWATQLPISADLLTGHSSLLLPGQLIVADQDVFSVDPATGAVQWRFHTTVGRRPGADAPVASGGTLYTGSGSGHVFALDEATGALRWRQAVADTSDSVFRPVTAGGIVYVGVSRFPVDVRDQIGSRVVALEAATGAIRWTRDLPLLVPKPGTGVRDIVLVGSLIIASTGDGLIHALDIATGATRWTAPRAQPPKGSIFTDPLEIDARGLATDGIRIYASSTTGTIEALSPTDGRQLWASPANLGSPLNLRTDGGSVFVVYFYGPFAVLDASTGAVRWSYAYPDHFTAAPDEKFTGAASSDAAHVYLSGLDGFYAFRKE